MDLTEMRTIITKIDQEIIHLISERISLVPNLVDYKNEFKISIFQPEHEKQLYSKYWQIAVERKVNPELVRQIFELLIEETRNLQYEMTNH